MVKHVFIETVDDLNGIDPAREVRFSLDGREYRIDLGTDNEEELRHILKPYILAGRNARKTDKPAKRRYIRAEPATNSRAARLDRVKVRTWAKAQNLPVSSRGKISWDILRAYQNAFPNG